ncbi:hypothetical protein [Clostridium autoethanogenum]|uniref:Uncharacterized protein n=1 Tax=Clostridium autoethanogenum DSM 10061 TaxID=1341692 RepID=A0ABM5NZ69_9CLOT|nr:hypothetical protein [Clostridium autoethanogenum]AGY77971.1 hypothetical protein CAETHG_3770 [Clostridium autoethanogenum DSM 10061]ALU38105.1 Hypothetical protein CLAU_3678 [Clostridium autoethanogenum DSM 10061]OVY50869.1 hypothetical protein WX72_02030 [Clostridium autoethanogenum]
MEEDRKKHIRTKSLNAITYILYKNPLQDLEFWKDESNGQILFQVSNSPENLSAYLDYKKAVRYDYILKVDLILYNNILRSVKYATKEYRNN